MCFVSALVVAQVNGNLNSTMEAICVWQHGGKVAGHDSCALALRHQSHQPGLPRTIGHPSHHPELPATPLNGPTSSGVIQPP